MGLLTLFEKIELPEKLELNEDVISLDGTKLVDSLKYLKENYPIIFNLIDKNKWDEAFNYARNNTSQIQTVDVNNKVNLDSNQKILINDLAEDHGLQVNFSDDGKSFTLIAEDKDAVNNISDVINYLDGKDYTSGKLKKVNPTLNSNREVNYNDDNGIDLGNVVLDAFIYSKPLGPTKNHTVADVTDESGQEVFKSLALQLGLNSYDNPFIDFMAITPIDRVKYTKEHLAALNNLYSEGTIDNRDLADPNSESIVQNVGLYKNNTRARDVYDLVNTYFSERDQSRKEKFFINDPEDDEGDGLVKNWSDIKKELGVNFSAGDNGRTYRLSREADKDELQRFYQRLTPEQKGILKSIVK